MRRVFAPTVLTVLLGLAPVPSVGLLVTTAEADHKSKFELVGTATFAKDPTDQSNIVIKVDNTTGFGGVRRVLNARRLYGVFVDGDRVGMRPLSDGDELTIGRFRLYFMSLTEAGLRGPGIGVPGALA